MYLNCLVRVAMANLSYVGYFVFCGLSLLVLHEATMGEKNRFVIITLWQDYFLSI